MEINSVITHGGQFHADEILAVAVIRLILPNISVSRKFKITPTEYNDPTILVIDVGRFYNPEKGLFDHHQDRSLMASNLLILDAYYEILGSKFGLSSSESYRMYMYLMQKLFLFVSNIDKGQAKDIEEIPTFNSIIRSMNALDATYSFDVALKTAELAIEGYIESLVLIIKGEKEWEHFQNINDKVKLQETQLIIPNWKEIAKKEDILAIVQPNTRGGWQMVSRDTNKLVLPESDKASFRHESGFLIVFDNKEDVLEYAIKIEDFYGTK